MGDKSTGGYEGFTNLLSQIDRKGKSVNMTNPLPLGEYISKSVESYFSYTGSLTTPPCSEEVTWIDFTTPIDITEKQVNKYLSEPCFLCFTLYSSLAVECLPSADSQR